MRIESIGLQRWVSQHYECCLGSKSEHAQTTFCLFGSLRSTWRILFFFVLKQLGRLHWFRRAFWSTSKARQASISAMVFSPVQLRAFNRLVGFIINPSWSRILMSCTTLLLELECFAPYLVSSWVERDTRWKGICEDKSNLSCNLAIGKSSLVPL